MYTCSKVIHQITCRVLNHKTILILWTEVLGFRHTALLETIGPFARGKTSSLPIAIAANSLRWDENRDCGKDESNRKPR